MRYYLLAFAAFVVASAVMYLICAFVAVSFNPADWAAPGRLVLAMLDVVFGVLIVRVAHKEAEEVRRLVRLDLADREADARWHDTWERKKR